jgi:hypothetical protein
VDLGCVLQVAYHLLYQSLLLLLLSVLLLQPLLLLMVRVRACWV